MDKKTKFGLLGLLIFLGLVISFVYLNHVNIPVLEPQGIVAQKQLKLILLTLGLSAVVVIPVFALTITIGIKYREGNHKSTYKPNWDGNNLLEIIWWLIPAALILILGMVIWKSSYALDPYKPLSNTQKPIVIDVIALDWKWLFLYPEENIATVNYLQIPVGRPIHFNITADAPMNSLWIPQLGSQIYAMPGMSTELNLDAKRTGNYYGSSANISGTGYAGMNFITHATPSSDYARWVKDTQRNKNELDSVTYAKLAKPSQNNPPSFYGSYNEGLYDSIIMKYMGPMTHSQHSAHTGHTEMMQ